ncbi:Uncharacterized conserved protein, DUF362 family [Geoalkalibacter ferrihydriticus]|uniref:(4Fe-4S)-binding protein n=2 Tax=Geoalkalibacter ferrihydriticus TaxID=392333 RepID=A0A0C2EEH5_9BACT|nr:DUF362 domain-containing protein [Geoalkalibacter ferrihydriticus]KIH77028.1 (4Fe-4S)-binding protein [Geoalkalibacter ferrihydriticus DSM 17813]SDL38126.1 Uncharacterized conserved protein, DUF362 family [Geoalkalibacter ferrihydriticus]
MNRVVLHPLASYDRAACETALTELLAPLGGMVAFVQPGQRVLIKPNMLAGKSPDRAVTTHPEIVRAVIRQVQDAGGEALVGDSPGVGSCVQVARKCGILAVVEETGARLVPFAESLPASHPGATFHHLELAREVFEADLIINLPKLKTHQMMGLTCAVKNLFGAVVGMRKPQLHLQAGSDKAQFAQMLLDLAGHLQPALSIVDAVVAMQGDGPGSGDPIAVGALLAGENPLAVDAAALELLGLEAADCWTQKIACAQSLPGAALTEVEVLGTNPQALRPRSFRPAKATDVSFGVPPLLRRHLRRSLSALPAIDAQRCSGCGLCIEHCPPTAMAMNKHLPHIDLKRCIGCFCCQELCPSGAILTRQGLLLRLSRFLFRAPQT